MRRETDATEPDVAARETPVSKHMSRQILAVRDDCSLGTAMETALTSRHRHVVVDSRGTFRTVTRSPCDGTTAHQASSALIRLASLEDDPGLTAGLVMTSPTNI